jgi:hypothetical protein
MPLRIYTRNGTVFPPESYSEEDLNALEKLFSGSGYSKYGLEQNVLRIHIPAGKSLKDVLHWAQQPLDEGYRNHLKAQLQLRVRNANGENVTTSCSIDLLDAVYKEIFRSGRSCRVLPSSIIQPGRDNRDITDSDRTVRK